MQSKFMGENIINVLNVIFGFIVGYYLSTKRHVFEKVYDQKLLCMVDLYKQIIRVEFALRRYVHFTGAETEKESSEKRIEELNEVKRSFQKFQHKFWEMEILLDDNSVVQIEKFNKTYIAITSKLSVSNINQQLGDAQQSYDYWNKSFETVSRDLAEIKDKIKREFKKTLKKR